MMRSAKKTYEIDMLHGAILPKLLRFAVPLTLSTMLQLLFNAADVVVVGRWAGDNSLAAVGSNTSLIALLTNMFLGLSIGANILAARYFGAHEDEELSKTVHTSILLSLYSGVFLTVVGILGARTILIWMQCPANVLDLATLYLRIYFAGMTATMLYNFGAALLRASGDTQRPLYYLFASGVVNVILNLVFVIYFHMDVAGVALATVISQCISAALVGPLPHEGDRSSAAGLPAAEDLPHQAQADHAGGHPRRNSGNAVLSGQRDGAVLRQLLR